MTNDQFEILMEKLRKIEREMEEMRAARPGQPLYPAPQPWQPAYDGLPTHWPRLPIAVD